jgi:phospholipid/cholesterol/gamma-HCH transport system ATP-binding protein
MPISTPTVPLIEVRKLVKRFDGKTVLDGLDLTVERGETVVVVGGSGSGKTTLARLLIGLDRPTAGQVLLEGVDLTTLDDRALIDVRRRFAMVFQKYALLDSIDVFDNVAFPLREERRHDEATIRERVMVTLHELGLEGAARKFPAELSGGMAKRIGIARALVTEPEILVYDEPTSGLDPVTSRVVDGLIEGMRTRHLVTSIVITHDMMTAYAVADRIVLLAHGRVAVDGDPETIFRSNNEDIARFAISSGVDLTRLGSRKARLSPSEIRARWTASHAAPKSPTRPHRFRSWHSA